jgi:hypothetical protein
VIVLFPYFARVEVQPQWEAFLEHNRFLLRGLLIAAGIPALMVLIASVSRHLFPGLLPSWIIPALGLAWIAFSVYFAGSLPHRQKKLLCPCCGQPFIGRIRMRYDSCNHCGLEVWSADIGN